MVSRIRSLAPRRALLGVLSVSSLVAAMAAFHAHRAAARRPDVASAHSPHHAMRAPAPDITTAKVSQHGLYRARVHSSVDPIPAGRLHGWTIHLETVAGAPVDGATFAIDGGMPQYGHGLPTRPRVTRALGRGDYQVEGLKFSMAGWWRMQFAVHAAAGSDTVVFNFSL